jgi:hypothetical protein
MVSKVCKICGDRKDAEKDFYKGGGLTCRSCKSKYVVDRAREVKGVNTEMLVEILDNQRSMKEELLERIDEMEREMAKMRKALKKLTVE